MKRFKEFIIESVKGFGLGTNDPKEIMSKVISRQKRIQNLDLSEVEEFFRLISKKSQGLSVSHIFTYGEKAGFCKISRIVSDVVEEVVDQMNNTVQTQPFTIKIGDRNNEMSVFWNGFKIAQMGNGSVGKQYRGEKYEGQIYNDISELIRHINNCYSLDKSQFEQLVDNIKEIRHKSTIKLLWPMYEAGYLCDVNEFKRSGKTNTRRNKNNDLINSVSDGVFQNPLNKSAEQIADCTIFKFDKTIYISIKDHISQMSSVMLHDIMNTNTEFQLAIQDGSNGGGTYRNYCYMLGIDPNKLLDAYREGVENFNINTDIKLKKYNQNLISNLFWSLLGCNYWLIAPDVCEYIPDMTSYKFELESVKISKTKSDSFKTIKIKGNIKGVPCGFELRTDKSGQKYPCRLFVDIDKTNLLRLLK